MRTLTPDSAPQPTNDEEIDASLAVGFIPRLRSWVTDGVAVHYRSPVDASGKKSVDDR
jgi:hypothetical protein